MEVGDVVSNPVVTLVGARVATGLMTGALVGELVAAVNNESWSFAAFALPVVASEGLVGAKVVGPLMNGALVGELLLAAKVTS